MVPENPENPDRFADPEGDYAEPEPWGSEMSGSNPAKLPRKENKKTRIMADKDKQDEAQRHAQRNYVIREVRSQLVTRFGYTYTDADIFIGRIWGLGERKIREIIRTKAFSAVSADDLAKLAVILSRLSGSQK